MKGCDVVIDGLDTLSARYIVNRACIEENIPYVFGGGIELRGNATTIIPKTTACLECFYPGIDDRLLDRCAIVGVHPSILGIISSIQVYEATRLIVGKKPNLMDRLLYVDLPTLTFETITIKREEGCPACGVSPVALEERMEPLLVEESCGRDGRATYHITPSKPLELDVRKLERVIEKNGYSLYKKETFRWAFISTKEYSSRY